MSETGQTPARVGIRELRQNLSVYLERVKDGETLDVTEHGHPVAQLRPLAPPVMSALERMVADGTARPPIRDLADVLGTLPQIEWPRDAPLASELLIQMRDEEPY
ncbi:MAG: type II toxin-antitoxin system prevent-host-death family antitoxin [Chloroflexi bacterium]|nr:type II toxin-antitoxin system prevent-host-death family antitoxin [Chloroflexota bacterium]